VNEIETRLLEAAKRLEQQLTQRADEVRENEAALLAHCAAWTKQLNGWERRLDALEGQFSELSSAFAKLSKR
jgi:FtsZ-binding cell division protein ZapB